MVVASSSDAVITSDAFLNRKTGIPGSVPFTAWYGCLRAVSERRLLTEGEASPGYFDSLGMQQVVLAGRFVAFVFRDIAGKGSGCEDSVAIYDLRTGQPGDVFTDDCGAAPGGSSSSIDSLRLESNGFAAWHTMSDLQPTEVTGMSCPSVSVCVATDSAGNVLTTTDPAGGPQSWTIAGVAAGGLYGISCPTQNLCVAVGGSNIYTSTDPTGGSGTWTVTPIDGVGGLGLVSCPSTSLCVVTGVASGTVAITPIVVTSTDPTGGAAAWTSTRIAVKESFEGISCPSTSLCVAGGVANPGTASPSIVTSTDPTGGASAWTATTGLPQVGVITSISCPSTTLCIAGSGPGMLGSTNPTGGASAWHVVATPTTGIEEPAISCASTTLCVAGTYSGVITSTNPTGGTSAWTPTPIAITGAVQAISCPSTALCVAGDAGGDILTSTNPTGGLSAWSSKLIDTPPACNNTSPCLVEHVYAYGTHGSQALATADGGTGNTITNIQLSGNQLTWTNNGLQNDATLN